MSENPAVRLILQPIRKCLDAADRVDAWHDEHKEDIASSRAELGLSTEQTADHRKFVVTDVERSLDPLGLINEIEGVAERLDRVGEPHIANRFRAILDEVDEDEGDEHLQMDALKELLQQHGPSDEAKNRPANKVNKNRPAVDHKTSIGPDERTIPLSHRKAGKLIGKGDSQHAARWVASGVEQGTIPCEHISRQSHVFSMKSFPANARKNILPK